MENREREQGESPECMVRALLKLGRKERGACRLGFALLASACSPQPHARVVCAEGSVARPAAAASAAPLAGSATSSSAMPASTPPETAAADAGAEPEPPSIEAFDCFTVEGPGETRCEPVSPGADESLAPPGSQGFRRWAGGGPNGVAWNPFHVSCRARVRAHCSMAAVTLRISSRVVKALPLPHAASPQFCQFDVSSDDLEKNQDQATPNEFEPPFPTAIFRVEVGQSCGEPPSFGVARDAFVGGFAFGE